MTKISEHIKDILSRIPEQPGIYQYYNKVGEIIYVGKAKNLKRRVTSYFHKEQDRFKTQQLVKQINDIQYVVVENEQDAFLLENNLIKKYQPHYNILLKDGKSYPSICITKEPYPRIIKTRQIDKQQGEYYGPYCNSGALELVLDVIHKLYPIRTCNLQILKNNTKKNKTRVCLKYHLGNCCGICERKIDDDAYNDFIEKSRQIIKGNAHILQAQIWEQMREKADAMKYEEAGKLKMQYDLLEQFRSKTVITHTNVGDMDVFGYDETDSNVYVSILHIHEGSIVQGEIIEYQHKVEERKEELLAHAMMELRNRIGSNTMDALVPFIPDEFDENLRIHIAINGEKKKLLNLAMRNVMQYKLDRIKQASKLNPQQHQMHVLNQLKNLLGLERTPLFIDSFDNSSLQGSNAVAACIVFKMGKPSKRDYKLFSIKTVQQQDDYATMKEVAKRRYTHLIKENAPLPDLIIADGGIGQMNALREATEDLHISIPIAGLKKDDHHRTNTLLYGFPAKEIGMKVTDEVFRLMVYIQDEVHRVAISYHKKKRSKAQTISQLDDIQGVGPKIKEKILLHFGSVSRVRTAELYELEKIVSKSLASTIYNYFRQ